MIHRNSVDPVARNKIIEGITYVALAADHLLTVVLGGKGLKRGFDNATAETKDEMESRFLFVDTQVSISIFASDTHLNSKKLQ